MGGVLGEGTTSAFIYNRGGDVRIAELESVSEVAWSRQRNATSIAQAVAMVPGGIHERCCEVLGNIHTWVHELVIFRDEERVWEGPITNVRWSPSQVTIAAQDVTVWTQRRARYVTRQVTASPVRVEMLADIQQAFQYWDPNVWQFVTNFPLAGEAVIDRQIDPWSGYYYDGLLDLSKQGASFTTVGRRIIVWPDGHVLGRTATLWPGLHMAPDADVVESGMDLATGVLARGTAASGGTEPAPYYWPANGWSSQTEANSFYTALDRIIDAQGVTTTAALGTVAQTARGELYPPPLFIEMPAGATLICDAPVTMPELVPGTIVPLESRVTCRDVSATMVLDNVSVKVDPGGSETVGITLLPYTSRGFAP